MTHLVPDSDYWKMRYRHRIRGRENDFIGGGTNGRGHAWNLGFQAIEPMKIGASLFFNPFIVSSVDCGDVPMEGFGRDRRGRLAVIAYLLDYVTNRSAIEGDCLCTASGTRRAVAGRITRLRLGI